MTSLTATGTTTPAATGTTTAAASGGTTTPSLPANVSQTLDVIYNAYVASPSDFPANIPTTNMANRVEIQGTNVGIDVHDSNPADFNNLVAELQSAGMQITTSNATYGIVDGFVPVAQLPAVGAIGGATSVSPLFQPTTH